MVKCDAPKCHKVCWYSSHVYAAECNVSHKLLEDSHKLTGSMVPRAGDMKFKVSPQSACAVEHLQAQHMSGLSVRYGQACRCTATSILHGAADGQLHAPLAV